MLLEPDIDLGLYRVDAVIDWIAFRMETVSEHQAVNMHRRIMRLLGQIGSRSTCAVYGPKWKMRDRKWKRGYQGTKFIVQLQQPEPRELAWLMRELPKQYAVQKQECGLFPIAGIEVSVDFYPIYDPDHDQARRDLLRWQMVELLRRHVKFDPILTESVRGKPRAFHRDARGKGSSRKTVSVKLAKPNKTLMKEATRLGVPRATALPLNLRAHTQPPVDWTAYAGAREFGAMARIMDKKTDQKNPLKGTALSLADHEHRARIEMTLKHTKEEGAVPGGLGLETARDLFGFRFSEIRKMCFDFHLPTVDAKTLGKKRSPGAGGFEIEVFKRSGVYGVDLVQRIWNDMERQRCVNHEIAAKPDVLRKKGYLLAYEPLNRRVKDALARLTGYWDIRRTGASKAS
ncbi:hypothetical protein DDZ14_19115 [Maritimibacter sp. 55A14]|nr:hypothetical protein DDZ14_19115 [Maritimibacter sp. 55A14]